AALCGRPSEELEAAWKLYDRAKVAKGAQGEAQVPVEWDAVKWKAHWGRRIEELTREALVPQHQAPKHPWRTSDAGVDEEATEPPKLWEQLLADASPKDLQFLEFWYAGVAAGIPEAEARRVAAEVTRPNSPRQAALNA